MKDEIELYPDASATPGLRDAVGAWVAVVDDEVIKIGHHDYPDMAQHGGELMTAADALAWAAPGFYRRILLYPDSTLVFDALNDGAIEEYAERGWRKRSPRNSSEKASYRALHGADAGIGLANKEAWQYLYAQYLTVKSRLTVQRIPSHSGHKWNDLADKIAKNKLRRRRAQR